MSRTVNLSEAKTQLSSLVEAAAGGEEIVIAKNGVAKARLVFMVDPAEKRRAPSGLLNIAYIAEDFDARALEIEQLFDGD